jgi:uncharacterized repeat protein (TIGR01451 family)
MKKTFINIRETGLRALVFGFALLALLSFILPQAAQASTAANTVIRNTVTVNFNDTKSNPMTAVTATVDITVNYVYAKVTLSAPSDQFTDPNTAIGYSYTITSNANGPDTYNLTKTLPLTEVGISGSTAAFSNTGGSITSVILGATTAAAAAASGTAVITVPNDAASNTSINGIEAGDIVVIGGNPYTVLSIVDNGGTVVGTSTITLTTNLTTSVLAGDPIYERQNFTMTVTPGTVASGAITDPTITVTTNATSVGLPSLGATTDDTITTIHIAKLGVVKTVSPNGTTYYDTATAPKFITGNTIWYKVVVTNNGSSNATSVTLTDPVPAYTTYVSNSTTLNGKTVLGDGSTSPLLGAGLLVDDDNPVRVAGNVASGILHSAGVATVIFKVTVN